MPARPLGHCECLLGQGHNPFLCGMAPWPLGPTQAPVPSTNTQYQYPALALSISTQHQHPVLSTSTQHQHPVHSTSTQPQVFLTWDPSGERGGNWEGKEWAGWILGLTLLLSDTSMFLFASHNSLASQSDIIADTVIVSVLFSTHRPSPSWHPS